MLRGVPALDSRSELKSEVVLGVMVGVRGKGGGGEEMGIINARIAHFSSGKLTGPMFDA